MQPLAIFSFPKLDGLTLDQGNRLCQQLMSIYDFRFQLGKFSRIQNLLILPAFFIQQNVGSLHISVNDRRLAAMMQVL